MYLRTQTGELPGNILPVVGDVLPETSGPDLMSRERPAFWIDSTDQTWPRGSPSSIRL